LLSHALLATWEHRRGRTFTVDGYRASGGVRGAIAHTAESVFTDQLNHEQQDLARDVFLRLTELGEGTEDTRRRTGLNELVHHSGDAAQLRSVLNILAEARLITLNDDSAEVAHEALIREWTKLREWLTQDRDGLRLHRHLTESAGEWEARGRDASELYRGARLAQVREWAEANKDSLNQVENAYLNMSIEEEERDALEQEAQRERELEAAREQAEVKSRSEARLRGRNRIISVVGTIALILAIFAGVFAVQSNTSSSIADHQRQVALHAQATAEAESMIRATQQSIAESNFFRAEAQRLAAEASELLKSNGSPELAALLGLRSMNIQYSPQADAVIASAAQLNFPRQVFNGHTDAIANMAFSPDGKYIVTSSEDQTVRLWDVRTGQQIREFNDPNIFYATENIRIAISADSRYVLTIRYADVEQLWASIWNIETGERVNYFFDANRNAAAAFSQDGTQLYLGSVKGVFRILDIETGELMFRSFIPSNDILQISSDGTYAIALSANDRRVLQVWDTTAASAVVSQELSYSAGVLSNPQNVAISPDNQRALIGYVDGTILLWDLSSGKVIQTFTGHSSEVRSVKFSPDGEYVISGGLDQTARLWSVQSGDELLLIASSKVVNTVAFSPDGESILTGKADGTVQLWNTHPHPRLPIFGDQNRQANLSGMAFSPDGNWLAVGGADGFQVWDVGTGELQTTFFNAGTIKFGLRFSPNSLTILSGDRLSGVASLWDVSSGKQLRNFAYPINYFYDSSIFLNDIAFSSDGALIAASPDGDYVRIWDQTSTNPPGLSRLRDGYSSREVVSLAFSPDDQYIMTITSTGIVNFHDIRQGSLVKKIDTGVDITGAAYSPDGKIIATAGVDHLAVLWNIETGSETRQFVGHTDALFSVAFSQDGKFLGTASADGTARLWDVATGEELRRFIGHTAGVTNIAISPDNRFLATVSNDGSVRLWDLDYRATIQYICSRLLRDFTDEERIQYNITDHEPTCGQS
jgi:WD40 repeat protein